MARELQYLVVQEAPALRKELCLALLAAGVRCVPADSTAAAVAAAKEQEIDAAVIDLDADQDAAGSELLAQLRGLPERQNLPIIAVGARATRETLTQLMDLGLVGYLLKPIDREAVVAKLEAIAERLAGAVERRRHVRITPDPGELLRVHFRLRSHRGLISGRIVDISMGGLACELHNAPGEDLLRAPMRVAQLDFVLDAKQYRPPAEVVVRRQSIIAFRFETLADGERASLASYIFRHLGE